MINAKTELLQDIKYLSAVKCARIESKILKVNYTQKDCEQFIDSLDFMYHEGSGSQNLYGTVWLDDGSWLERCEYGGSEWWEHKQLPAIPKECL